MTRSARAGRGAAGLDLASGGGNIAGPMTTMSLGIRLAAPHDAAAVGGFGERSFRETFGPHNRPEDMDAYCRATYALERQRAELAAPDRLTLLAEVDGVLAGYAQLRDGPAPACVTGAEPIELLRFYVDSRWHGQGIAAALMAQVIAHARRRGRRTLFLAVWEHNPRAIAFYRKQGFEEVGSQPFQLGQDVQTDRVMARALAEG
jgi:GNAT superfamily N-acetyltransferase